MVRLDQGSPTVPVYNVLEAKTHLSKLIDAVESGREKEVIIARNGKPVVRIAPLENGKKPVRLGLAKGKFEVPEDIDGANDIIEKMFYGEDG